MTSRLLAVITPKMVLARSKSVRVAAYITGVARLWDTNMADKAAAIDQATRLGGVVVHPPKVTGFDRPPEPERGGSHGSHLPGQPDEEF